MTNTEINFIMDAIEVTTLDFPQWMKDYTYDTASNEFMLKELFSSIIFYPEGK